MIVPQTSHTLDFAPDTEPTPWGWLTALTLLALVLRGVGLDGGLWYDEIRTLLDSVRSPLGTIITVFPGNNQHTLFSIMGRLSVLLFGEHAWSLRLPAMLIGTATVPMLYLFARELVGRSEALLAAFLLAVAYHPVWFSQNARGYSTLAFLTLLSSWLLIRGLRRGKASDFAWYAVAAALGLYAHLTMVFLVVSHALLCVMPLGVPFTRGWWERWRLPAIGLIGAALLTMILYAPVLLAVRQFYVDRPSPMLVATPRWALLELIRGLGLGVGTWAAGVVGLGLAGIGLWSYWKQDRFAVGLFLLPGVVTVSAAVALERPIFPRFLFFAAGFALLIVVRGALETGRLLHRSGSAPRRVTPVGAGLVGLMATASLIALLPNYRYPKQDFGGALAFVEDAKAAEDVVVTFGLARPVYGEYYRRPFLTVSTLEQLDVARRRQVGTGGKVWGIYTMEGYIESQTPDLMARIHEDCAVSRVFRGTVGKGDVTVCAFR